MSTHTPKEVQHSALVPTEEKGSEEGNTKPSFKQDIKRERYHPSDKEIRRRLWRIYELAFAAADRVKPP